jgi:hypothetical protein
MIKARADELVAALRSGKYTQTIGQLRNGNAFCCLGVACDISKLGEWNGNSYFNEEDVLPNEVADYFGFHNSNGGVIDHNTESCLSELNDHGHSFAEIADFIEANLERL